MAQQEEPLYDFPEPTQPSGSKVLGLQRGRGSLKSISVLDRLLLTVPVWLQLSINPATALHILQREPPGTFLIRRSRTSKRNVLCVRLEDDSVPSFVQQFGIREEHSSNTLALETSAISFPDLPRLIAFYCVSRDVLPFPLELPEAIARATSHKELESISHMGIEFWNSHVNVRGPREAPKPLKDDQEKPDVASLAALTADPQTSSTAQPDSDAQPSSDNTVPEPDAATQKSGPNSSLFHEFCPISTRSPRELDCGSGLGALCFINPLFLQSENSLSRRRMFKRSLKVRISTETTTLLAPPDAPPPPPPLMPKTKRRCKVQAGEHETGHAKDTQPLTQILDTQSEAQVHSPSDTPHSHPEVQEQEQTEAGVKGEDGTALLPRLMEPLQDDSGYMTPPPMKNLSHSPSLSPYMSPMAPPFFPKMSQALTPHDSMGASPSLSPYQSPSLSPKVPLSLSPYESPDSSPSPSPKLPLSISPLISPSFSQLTEEACCTQAAPESLVQGEDMKEEGKCTDKNKDKDGESKDVGKRGEEEKSLVSKMSAASLNDMESCEEAAKSLHPPHNKELCTEQTP
ncbi:uncharacterized protein KZ484_017097 [Pholidichthys leucotaenia]